MKKIVIVGAGGHGKVVADIAKLNGYSDISFLDDDESKTEWYGYPVVGKTDDLEKYDCDQFVAMGDAKKRRELLSRISRKVTLIHPNATVADSAVIGEGSVIMAGVVINPDAIIGTGCIINTCSSIDHDSVVGDYVHIAVGTHLGGTVHVGENSWVGTGAILINNINVCSGCTIGAGAVVIKDIDNIGTYVGIPAARRR